MAKEKQFIIEAQKRAEIEEFLSKEFARAGYSHSEIARTPLAMRITVWAHKPGMIIGRGGKNIDALTTILKERFGIENPQLEVQEVQNPDLDPEIVAKQIAAALERGLKHKRIAHLAMQRVMDAGAAGVAIRIAGKLGGDMSRVDKFSAGYLKYSGEPAARDVRTAYASAQVKLGTIGIQVRILTKAPTERIAIEKLANPEVKVGS
ncbi:MAG: 30S ribosomal protein S3 [Candidatus Aenigmatarchaeota archaeon]|nr:30S ribosomal protein S3 [Candidatus Aenigmarchaeota archaeon]